MQKHWKEQLNNGDRLILAGHVGTIKKLDSSGFVFVWDEPVELRKGTKVTEWYLDWTKAKELARIQPGGAVNVGRKRP